MEDRVTTEEIEKLHSKIFKNELILTSLIMAFDFLIDRVIPEDEREKFKKDIQEFQEREMANIFAGYENKLKEVSEEDASDLVI